MKLYMFRTASVSIVRILEWNSICFGQSLCPSSGVYRCTHSNGTCHTSFADCCCRDPDPASSSQHNLYDT